jgi:hypothetical protein
MRNDPRPPNPKRVAAGRLNRLKCKPITDARRAQMRHAAREQRPWRFSTGPKTPAGKAQSVLNGKKRQKGKWSQAERRQIAREGWQALIGIMETTRQVLDSYLALITPKDAEAADAANSGQNSNEASSSRDPDHA